MPRKAMPEPRNHYYDGWLYRRLVDPNLKPLRKQIAEWTPAGSTVLDVGCGTGDQLIHLAPHIQSGIGLELSETMVRTASRRSRFLDQLEFRLGTAAEPFAFDDGHFDLVLSTMVIHEMPSTIRLHVLREMKRVARVLILADFIVPLSGFWQKLSTHTIEFIAGRDHYRGFRSYMREGGMPALLDRTGVEILESRITAKGTVMLWRCQ